MAATLDGTMYYGYPEGIFSLLDTDLYKLTMQNAVLRFFPLIHVKYSFTNRTPHMKLTKEAFIWLLTMVDNLANIRIHELELEWLRRKCSYFSPAYLTFLEKFRFRPKEHVKLSFYPPLDSLDSTSTGEVSLEVSGLWVDTILYEIPLLALISEAYFKFVDTDWTYDGQMQKAKQKALTLIENGCAFSEFGSRRRRDYRTHEMVVQGLVNASNEAAPNNTGYNGVLTGTSNVHMAQRFGMTPIGTVAHEWFMGIAAIEDDYPNANLHALKYWTANFGEGVLAIALTDTFGTPSFLKAFAKPAPHAGTIVSNGRTGMETSYADVFTGVRQDSGGPMEFITMMKDWYTAQGLCREDKPRKTIVFSDSLNIEKCLDYRDRTLAAGLNPSFGIGTFFTNDFDRASRPGEKSVPLNIVIKLSEADGRKAVKLSDNKGKNTGDDELVKKVKQLVGYEEREWVGGDETRRWDQ